jgi:hypothetical protein
LTVEGVESPSRCSLDFALKGKPAGEHLVEHDAQRPEVRAAVGGLGLSLLGTLGVDAVRRCYAVREFSVSMRDREFVAEIKLLIPSEIEDALSIV